MSKDAYRDFCKKQAQLPLFFQDWWLDACSDNGQWGVAVARNSANDVIAALPYLLKRKYKISVVTQPVLTPWLGVFFADGVSLKENNRKLVLEELIAALPKYHRYNQCWHYSFENWMPLHWLGFKQTTRYTYVINGLKDIDSVWGSLKKSTRSDIKKATERYKLRIADEPSFERFWNLHTKVFSRQGLKAPYRRSLVERIDKECALRECRKIVLAVDENGVDQAAVYMVWDAQCAYYLMAGSDPQFRHTAANTYCLWESLKHASLLVDSFDFEGSMIEPVAKYMESFGGSRIGYHYISRTSSRVFSLLSAIRAGINVR